MGLNVTVDGRNVKAPHSKIRINSMWANLFICTSETVYKKGFANISIENVGSPVVLSDL